MSHDKPRERADIKKEISDREQDRLKRLRDTRKVVNDKKTETSVARSLRLSGTAEGAKDVKKSVESAARETDKEFKKQAQDLERKVFQKAKKLERELKQRSEATKADIANLRRATSKIDTRSAQRQVKAAETGAEKDRKHIDDSKKRQKTDRAKGEKERDKQKGELDSAKIQFKS